MNSFSRRERYQLEELQNPTPEFVTQLISTHKLWHERCEVIVPVYAAHDPEDLKLRGMTYNTGATKEERDNYNRSMVKIWAAPIRHIRLYSEGVPIAYPNRARAAKIFFHIKNHVATWSMLMGESMNTRSKAPPMEDFDLMLEFAQNLEQFLQFYYNTAHGNAYFKRPTMNRFAEGETRHFSPDSTYSRLREGIYGLLTDRQVRVDDIRQQQPQRIERVDTFTEDDEFALTSSLNRIRNT